MTPALAVAITALIATLLIAFLCWKLSRSALFASILCRAIAEMLEEPDPLKVRMIAEEARLKAQSEGLWKS